MYTPQQGDDPLQLRLRIDDRGSRPGRHTAQVEYIGTFVQKPFGHPQHVGFVAYAATGVEGVGRQVEDAHDARLIERE